MRLSFAQNGDYSAIGRHAPRQIHWRMNTYITKHSTAKGGKPAKPAMGISKILTWGGTGTL
jgi:hypothetical protein